MRNSHKCLWAVMVALTLLLVVYTVPPEASGETVVGGDITSDTVWKEEDSPFYVEDYVNILSGATLTIEKGVEVLFRKLVIPDLGEAIRVIDGKLIAIGTATEMIKFTPDPNSVPEVYGWKGIGVYEYGRADIKFCTIAYAGEGIHLQARIYEPGKGTHGNNITDNLIIRAGLIISHDSFGNYVARNNITQGGRCCEGIRVYSGYNNIIVHNTIYNNGGGGISFDNVSYGNLVAYNDIVNNNGFGLIGEEGWNVSRYNDIHHNNFIGNAKQASDNATNVWDDGYPSGGNYWSDYVGVDNCSGPNQDVCPDPDGIGDSPYEIDSDSEDRYPLMSPASHDGNPPLTDDIPPVAITGGNVTVGINESVTISGDQSIDNAGIGNFSWSLWDVSGVLIGMWDFVSFTRAFAEVGDYYAVLSVTDFAGNSDEDGMFILVREKGGEDSPLSYYVPPTAIALAFISLAICVTYMSRILARRKRRGKDGGKEESNREELELDRIET